MNKQAVFALMTFLHDLFSAVWIGGLIVFTAVVLPGLRRALGMGPQLKKAATLIQKRLSVAVYISMAGLWATGVLLARRSGAFRGFLSFDGPYSACMSIKHILVIAMVIIGLYRSTALIRRDIPLTKGQEKLAMGLLLVNTALGVLVLLLSGVSASLASVPPVQGG